MATINGLAILVEKESVKREIKSTDHPTETGLPTTSGIQKQPIILNINGVIVNNGKYTAAQIKTGIEKLQNAGSLITYKGNNTLKNLQIQHFNGDWSNKVWGGFVYTMELKEVRIAKPSYVKQTTTAQSQSTEKKNNPTLEIGARVIFKGGNVYVSSDATKPAANRGRSTCEITNINTRSWAKHQYHLISQDGKMVYGWVDKANIEGCSSTASTKAKTNSGTQQVTKR